MDDQLKKTVRKWALDNARKYDGKANPGAVIGKLLQENPELKAQLKELSPQVQQIIGEVNALGVEKQIEELKTLAPELLEEKKIVEKKELKPLQNAEQGKVVMRMAPSASGPLHIGHAVVFSLSSEYCKKYDGKLILRIEDTNPENIMEQAYGMIEEDLRWLTENRIAQTVVQSSRMETYYDYAVQLVAKGKAYICTCSSDAFRHLSLQKKACPCRDLPVEEQHKRWDQMFVEFEPGQAVMRIKTNIEDPNPAMRDWPAFRINHTHHPKTGDTYKVWPLMNFAVAIDDHELGMTHTIRGKDHVDNAKRQQHLYDFFGWKAPTHAYIGKINFEGLVLKTSQVKKDVEYGHFDGWDDIRLPFLAALRRRGFQPGAFQKFAIDMGVGLNDKTVPAEEFFKSLEAHNRDIIDPKANRYFFVDSPVKLSIRDAPELTPQLPLHPDHKDQGTRNFKTHTEFLIAKDDAAKIEPGKLYRLMDCLNFKQEGDFVFDSKENSVYKEKGTALMHWLPADADLCEVEIIMPNHQMKTGVGEPALANLDVGTIIQFERFGFCRLDKKEGRKLTFWFTHK